MSQYRLTRRGKVVLVLLVILLAYILFQLTVVLVNQVLRTESKIDNGIAITQTSSELGSNSTDSTEIVTTLSPIETTLESQSASSVENSPIETISNSGLLSTSDERNLSDAFTLVLFSSDKAELSDSMKKEIDKFSLTAQTYKNVKIRVTGVALKLIDESKSESIATARAKAVRDYLISLDIKSSFILMNTKVVDPKSYKKEDLHKALSVELYFDGYNPYNK